MTMQYCDYLPLLDSRGDRVVGARAGCPEVQPPIPAIGTASMVHCRYSVFKVCRPLCMRWGA